MNSSVRALLRPRVPNFVFILLFLVQLAWPQARATTGNTIARFEFQRGTNALGIVDVELFDVEKPETVRNFLLYVRSGAYSNLFMHRLVPNFVVPGGGFAVTTPASAERFSSFLTVTNYGTVPNEFNVGSRM